MARYTTGPVVRGADTDRIQVLAKNNNRRHGVLVVVSVLGSLPRPHHQCHRHHHYHHCRHDRHYHRHDDLHQPYYQHQRYQWRGSRCPNQYGHEHVCPCPCCRPAHRYRRRHKMSGTYRRLYRKRRWIKPGRTATFDIDLWNARRYEVRLHSSSANVLYYVSGYRSGRWWHEPILDPSTTFRHTQLIRLC